MEQQELINKIKTLLPQEKTIEQLPFENSPEIYGNQRLEAYRKGYREALQDTYKALPDIINYIYEDLRVSTNELTYYHNDDGVEEIEKGVDYIKVSDLLKLLDNKR